MKKAFSVILLLLASVAGYSQGPVFTGDSTQRIIYRGPIGSRYGIVNAIKDTASIPAARRTVGLTVFMAGVPYMWLGTQWYAGSVSAAALGVPNGIATLGPDGFVPFEQLPFTEPLDFHGFYNASVDTPNLTDGVGNKGDMYICIDTGSQNLGHGVLDFLPGDIIIADQDVIYRIVTRLGITQVPTDWNAVPGEPNSLINKPTTISGYGITDAVPNSRTITINGTTYDLSTGRTWNVGTVVSSDIASFITASSTNTLTNKRWTPRVNTQTNVSTSLTMDLDTYDGYEITAQAGTLTLNAPTGTPLKMQPFGFAIKDNGTARALTWNAAFNGPYPTTTVVGSTTWVWAAWNNNTSKWDLINTYSR